MPGSGKITRIMLVFAAFFFLASAETLAEPQSDDQPPAAPIVAPKVPAKSLKGKLLLPESEEEKKDAEKKQDGLSPKKSKKIKGAAPLKKAPWENLKKSRKEESLKETKTKKSGKSASDKESKGSTRLPAPPPPPPGSSSGVRGKGESPLTSPKTTQKPGVQPPGQFDEKGPIQMGNAPSDQPQHKEFKSGFDYRIDYYDHELIDLVKEMAQKFKVNFIISDKIKGGKITIICPNPVSREEAWQAFLSALQAKDMTIVKVGKFYKVIQTRDAQRSPILTRLHGEDIYKTDEVITYLLKLKHIELKDIERILKDIKSKSGEIISFEPTNSMIITDSSVNIRRMINIINELDLPSGRDAIHVIDIYYASAADIAEKLNQIFGEKGRSKKSAPKKKGRKKRKNRSPTPPPSSSEDAGEVTISNVIADDRTNQLIIVAQRDAMPRILDMINRLDVPIPGDGQVHVYYLENANAEELSSTLTGMAGRGGKRAAKKRKSASRQTDAGDLFEGEVKITADKATNSLVIVASTKDYNALKRVIQKLDLRRRQVFVEAVIMEITLKKNTAFGVAMQGGFTIDVGGETVPVYAGTTLGSMNSVYLDPTVLSGMAVGLRGPDLEGTEGIIGDNAMPSFSVLVQMLQTDSDANVLSTPHILTMDNEEAEIIVGSNVPFITGQARDSNNRPVLSIQRQDVALTMKIKPQINESDYVRLQIQQEITELVSISETLGPTTTKRAAKSTVVVKDNQTIVIGGLLRDRETNDADKVPILGDLPILGRLFRRDKDMKEKTNLLIFLTPHIIKDEEDFKRIFKRKIQERNEFLRKFYGTDDDYEFEVDYSQKTGLIETIRATYHDERKEEDLKEQEAKELIIAPQDGHSAIEIGVSQPVDSRKDPSTRILAPPLVPDEVDGSGRDNMDERRKQSDQLMNSMFEGSGKAPDTPDVIDHDDSRDSE